MTDNNDAIICHVQPNSWVMCGPQGQGVNAAYPGHSQLDRIEEKLNIILKALAEVTPK